VSGSSGAEERKRRRGASASGGEDGERVERWNVMRRLWIVEEVECDSKMAWLRKRMAWLGERESIGVLDCWSWRRAGTRRRGSREGWRSQESTVSLGAWPIRTGPKR